MTTYTFQGATVRTRIAKLFTASALLALTVTAGCADETPTGIAGATDNKVSGNGARVYEQVEFLGNPLVAEVTIVKANHDAYNRTMPYAPSAFRSETESFIVNVAGRPAGYAGLVASVLYSTGVTGSDMLIVDSSAPAGSAGWLRWVPPINAVYNGGNAVAGYGGRRLADDVVDIGLYAIFSNLLSPAGASCAPGMLPLCTDNVDANDKPFSNTFPYLAAPTL